MSVESPILRPFRSSITNRSWPRTPRSTASTASASPTNFPGHSLTCGSASRTSSAGGAVLRQTEFERTGVLSAGGGYLWAVTTSRARSCGQARSGQRSVHNQFERGRRTGQDRGQDTSGSTPRDHARPAGSSYRASRTMAGRPPTAGQPKRRAVQRARSGDSGLMPRAG